MDHEQHDGLGRFGGNPKSLKDAPTTRKKILEGDPGSFEGAAGERGTKPYDMDGSYNGNVQGPLSRTFMGKGKK